MDNFIIDGSHLDDLERIFCGRNATALRSPATPVPHLRAAGELNPSKKICENRLQELFVLFLLVKAKRKNK